MVILVICLVLGLTYYVLKDRGINLLSGIVKDTTNEDRTTTEESKTENTECTTTGTETKDCTVALDNAGWALYSLPQYHLSVEVPNYWPTINIFDEDIAYRWTYKHYKSTDIDTNVLPNYQYDLLVAFGPYKVPEKAACGGFCLHEHQIAVSIYTNSDHKSFEQVSALFYSNYAKELDGEMNGIIDNGSAKKWGMDVQQYTLNLGGTQQHIYLVVKSDYIYNVTYFISAEPAESQIIGQKVLDSMKFEE
jgi:hypothetical protein